MVGHHSYQADAFSLKALDWPLLCRKIADNCKTIFGEEFCLELNPNVFNPVKAKNYSKAILEIIRFFRLKEEFVPLRVVVSNLPLILEQIQKSGRIYEEDFAALVDFVKTSRAILFFVEKNSEHFNSIEVIAQQLNDFDAWSKRFFPLLSKDNKLSEQASEDLMALSLLAKDLKEKIRLQLESYLKGKEWGSYVQDSYFTLREGRYVIPLKSNFKGKVDGIVHDVSASEQTLFVEPQVIVKLNNELKYCLKEIDKEKEKILARIVEQTKVYVAELKASFEGIIQFDYLNAVSRHCLNFQKSNEEDCLPLCFRESSLDFKCKNLYHPLLLDQEDVVPHSFEHRNLFLVTGPNTGGKTMLLKSVGLSLLMSWCGMPVWASEFSLPDELSHILVELGDDQSVESALSTFSSHLQRLKYIYDSASSNSLVLIDEIATGTAPEEGQPFAQAYLENMMEDKNPLALVTTHYGRLKQFAMNHDKARIAAMGYDHKNQKPTYELILDIPGESSALDAVTRAGFEKSLVDRAYSLKGELPDNFKQAIIRLDQARLSFAQREKEMNLKMENLEEQKASLESQKSKYQGIQSQKLNSEGKNILKELQELKKELKLKIDNLKNQDSKNISHHLNDLSEKVKTKTSLTSKTTQKEAINIKNIKMGLDVELDNFGVGKIIDLPKKAQLKPNDWAVVQVGLVKTQVKISELKKPNQQELNVLKNRDKEKNEWFHHKAEKASAKNKKGSEICDLRGLRVFEAQQKLESYLNSLSAQGTQTLTVIHGHGLNKLKDMVRSYLDAERPDLVYRSGSWPGEGGGGVTVVENRE